MAPLEKDLRKLLETTEEAARDAAERAVQAVFGRLALTEASTPDSLKNDSLRLQLRERARQLGRGYAEGDATLQSDEAVRKGVPYLREELAYEVWHRMLFARFLAENDLLIHPVYKTPVSIADCAQLAEESTDGKDTSYGSRFRGRPPARALRGIRALRSADAGTCEREAVAGVTDRAVAGSTLPRL